MEKLNAQKKQLIKALQKKGEFTFKKESRAIIEKIYDIQEHIKIAIMMIEACTRELELEAINAQVNIDLEKKYAELELIYYTEYMISIKDVTKIPSFNVPLSAFYLELESNKNKYSKKYKFEKALSELIFQYQNNSCYNPLRNIIKEYLSKIMQEAAQTEYEAPENLIIKFVDQVKSAASEHYQPKQSDNITLDFNTICKQAIKRCIKALENPDIADDNEKINSLLDIYHLLILIINHKKEISLERVSLLNNLTFDRIEIDKYLINAVLSNINITESPRIYLKKYHSSKGISTYYNLQNIADKHYMIAIDGYDELTPYKVTPLEIVMNYVSLEDLMARMYFNPTYAKIWGTDIIILYEYKGLILYILNNRLHISNEEGVQKSNPASTLGVEIYKDKDFVINLLTTQITDRLKELNGQKR